VRLGQTHGARPLAADELGQIALLQFLGGPDFAYQIDAADFASGFELSVETDCVNAAPGGRFEVKVTASRMEYEGAIELSVTGLGDDLPLENRIIEEKKNETTLKISLPDRFEPGRLEHFSIEGRARIGERDVRAAASTLPALQKAFPNTKSFPPGLDGVIALGVRLGE
jgi:hypothetical protein